jgi:hypothetical protein
MGWKIRLPNGLKNYLKIFFKFLCLGTKATMQNHGIVIDPILKPGKKN